MKSEKEVAMCEYRLTFTQKLKTDNGTVDMRQPITAVINSVANVDGFIAYPIEAHIVLERLVEYIKQEVER